MKQTFKIIDEDDNIKEFEVIMAFKLASNNKYYLIYTDNTYTVEGKLNIYAANYDPNDDSFFEKIKTEEEWQIIENKLNHLKNKKLEDYK